MMAYVCILHPWELNAHVFLFLVKIPTIDTYIQSIICYRIHCRHLNTNSHGQMYTGPAKLPSCYRCAYTLYVTILNTNATMRTNEAEDTTCTQDFKGAIFNEVGIK